MSQPPTIRLTKQFRFEAAHALWNYDGPCRNIHGHSYVLYVTVRGRPITEPGDPKRGMVMDFSTLKKIVEGLIIGPFDHALMVNAGTPHLALTGEKGLFGKVVALPYQPTCENLIHDFAARLLPALPDGVELHSLRLHETTTAYAEWFASDNQNSRE
jgi:6-pyruvoyltetrahydropterin/6-carboxytetrahydropterin synthase